MLRELGPVGGTGILAAAIGVMHQPLGRPPAGQRHPQCLQREVLREARAEGPADHEPRGQVEDDRQIPPNLRPSRCT